MTKAAALALGCWLFSQAAHAAKLADLQHVVILYQENWSFDGLYGTFRGADGWANAGATLTQTGRNGKPLRFLPEPDLKDGSADLRFSRTMAVAPYDLASYVATSATTGDLAHRFYQEQAQIHGGKMDRFVAESDNGGLVLSYYDDPTLPERALAEEFTLCDHFFHGAFGGSFLNHIFLIAADTPRWIEAPAGLRAKPGVDGIMGDDGLLTPDGYAVNTVFPSFRPTPPESPTKPRIPPLSLPTIGDRLSAAGVSWAWYSGGWDDAMAGHPDPNFQYHHQPFVYFKAYAEGAPGRVHLKDEVELKAAIESGTLPAVSFVKFLGVNNEHPKYAALATGQRHARELVEAIRAKPDLWASTLIIVTYDEHGGRFDHVPPPHRDRWGPGVRVPTILIGPFAHPKKIETRVFETLSILRLIETRWRLPPLNERDAHAPDLAQALNLGETR